MVYIRLLSLAPACVIRAAGGGGGGGGGGSPEVRAKVQRSSASSDVRLDRDVA